MDPDLFKNSKGVFVFVLTFSFLIFLSYLSNRILITSIEVASTSPLTQVVEESSSFWQRIIASVKRI